MRWGLIGGAVVAAGAAAYAGTQLMQPGSAPSSGASGQKTNAPPARAQPAPIREAIAAGLKEALGAPGAAMASAAIAASSVARHQAGVSPSAEQTRTTTDEVPAEDGMPAGTRTVTVTTRVEGSGARRTVFTEFKISERRGDSGLNLRGKLIASVEVCPDADGVVPFEIDLQASGDNHFVNVVGTGGFSMNLSAKCSGKGTVNDSAVLTGYRKQIDGDYTIRGGENLGGKSVGSDQTARTRTATDGRFTVGSTVTVTSETRASAGLVVGIGDTRIDSGAVGGSGNDKATLAVAAMMDSIVDDAVRTLLQSAQNAWRGGECVEVVVAAPLQDGGKPNRTRPGEAKEIEARVRHRFEGAELPLPIEATLAGKDKLADPRRVERAPGRFAYTAGKDEKDWGRVDLKTVSRRGIGENSVDFRSRAELSGEFKVTNTGGPMQMTMRGTVTWQPREGAENEYVVASGKYLLTARRRDCTSEASGTLGPGDGELEVKRDGKDGAVVAYRGIGMKPIPFTIVCPKSQRSQTIPAPWFATGEQFKPVASGGDLAGSLRDPHGHWLWEWTFRH